MRKSFSNYLFLFLSLVLLSGCSSNTPAPTTTVYVTKTPNAPQNVPMPGLPDQQGNVPNGMSIAECINNATTLSNQANDLRDQAQALSRQAGYGIDADPTLAQAAREMDTLARQMNSQYLDALAACYQ